MPVDRTSHPTKPPPPPPPTTAMTAAARSHHHRTRLLPLLLLLSFTLTAIFLLTRTSLPPPLPLSINLSTTTTCDFTDGEWIYDEGSNPRYDGRTCKEIYKGWNCGINGKENAGEVAKWRWRGKGKGKGEGCVVVGLEAGRFLRSHRDMSIGFVGDSLNRNMFVSLICTLRRVSNDVKKWRPAKADRGFTFLEYNLTVGYHRTNLLARYGRWAADPNGGVLESLGYKKGYRVDVDVPDSAWMEAPSFHDIVIFNTGHWWWAPAKFDPVKSPMLFFKEGKPVWPTVSPDVGLDMVLKHMIAFVEREMTPGGIKIFRTQSPRHFEGGDWNQGGSCPRVKPLTPIQVEELFALEHNGTNVEARLVNQHLHKALKGSSFHVLDITHMSEFRADAHPSKAGGKKHDDCMHWCLPGLTDTWNDMLAVLLSEIER